MKTLNRSFAQYFLFTKVLCEDQQLDFWSSPFACKLGQGQTRFMIDCGKIEYTHIEWHLLLFNWSRSWTEDKIMKTWCLPRGRAGYLPLLLSKNCSCQWVNCKIDNDGNSRDNGSNLYLGEVSLSWPSSHPLFPSRSSSASSRWPGLADQTDGRASSRQEVLDLK